MTSATSGNDLLQSAAMKLVVPALIARGVAVDDLASLQAVSIKQATAALREKIWPARGAPGAPGLPIEMLAPIEAGFRQERRSGASIALAAKRTAKRLGVSQSLPRTAQKRLWIQLQKADASASADELDRRLDILILEAELALREASGAIGSKSGAICERRTA